MPCAALTAWHALVEVGRLKPGESVAILGTGGVSSFAIAFAKMQGAFVFLTSSSDEKLSRGKALGADVLVNYKSTPEWDAEILKQSGGAGVDHVLEVGGAGTMERSMNAPIVCNGHNNFVVSSSKPESLTTARNGKRRNNDFGRTPRRKR